MSKVLEQIQARRQQREASAPKPVEEEIKLVKEMLMDIQAKITDLQDTINSLKVSKS